MTEDRSLERAARSWLEVGPTRAPEAAVEAALARIQTTPQERDWLPWRTIHLNQMSRAVVGVAAIAVLLVGGAFLLSRTPGPGPSVGPSPSSPTASPSPSSAPSTSSAVASAASSSSASSLPTFSQTFVSKRMGYSVRMPDRWSGHPATDAWVSGATISWGGGSVDDLRSADTRLSVASQPLKAGETADQRLQAMIKGSPVCTAVVPASKTIPVGDQVGTVAVNGCVIPPNQSPMIPGERAYAVYLVVGGRAYDFLLDGAVDPAYLEAMLATVTFDPASAVDPSPSPS